MLRRQASDWLARLEGDTSPELEAEFRRWYQADPTHADAFERVRRSYASSGLLRSSDFARERKLELRRPAVGQQSRWAIAAALALVLLIPGLVLIARGGFSPASESNAVLLMSSLGEIRSVSLEDGSKITLDTASAVEVELGRKVRRAVLREGRARFEVAPDPRPFIIEAAATRVKSGLAVLDVQRLGEATRVEVLSGRATAEPESIEQQASAVTLGEGEGLSNNGQSMKYRVPIGGTGWTEGVLQFDGTPLSEAVALANRYSPNKIILSGEIASLRVTGAFRAADIQGLAKSLAQAFDLRLERAQNGDFLLSPKRNAPSKKKNGG